MRASILIFLLARHVCVLGSLRACRAVQASHDDAADNHRGASRRSGGDDHHHYSGTLRRVFPARLAFHGLIFGEGS